MTLPCFSKCSVVGDSVKDDRIWTCAGRLLPEKDYVPAALAPGEVAAAATQAPFELTARPAEQCLLDARPAGAIPQAEAATSGRGSKQALGAPEDPVLSAAFRQDVRQSNQENDPLEALLAEGEANDTLQGNEIQEVLKYSPALQALLTLDWAARVRD